MDTRLNSYTSKQTLTNKQKLIQLDKHVVANGTKTNQQTTHLTKT